MSRRNLAAAAALVSLLCLQPVAAETLPEALQRILGEHALIQVVDNDVAAARSQLSAERSAWLPRLIVRSNAGYQEIARDVGAGGTFHPNEVSVGASQLLWDFGATNAAITRGERNVSKEELEREAQRQNLLLAGLESHLKLLRAQQVLEYANQSETQIKRQTQLENIRLEAGSGYSTDLLQAKAQLAGAQARRVFAEGQLQTAANRYRAVFGDQLAVPVIAENVNAPVNVPGSEGQVLSTVAGKNIDILTANARAELSASERDALRRRELMPRIDLVLERSHKTEYDGFEGDRDDTRAMVQANWSFDLGLRQLSSVKAANFAVISEREKARYVQMQATEEARNAWTDLSTAQQRQVFLRDQVDLAQQFLQLARRERELGRRSLLDVLSGETNLLNAQSDASAAETDVVLAAFRVLRAAGTLDMNGVTTSPRQVMTLPVIAPARG